MNETRIWDGADCPKADDVGTARYPVPLELLHQLQSPDEITEVTIVHWWIDDDWTPHCMATVVIPSVGNSLMMQVHRDIMHLPVGKPGSRMTTVALASTDADIEVPHVLWAGIRGNASGVRHHLKSTTASDYAASIEAWRRLIGFGRVVPYREPSAEGQDHGS